MRKLFYVYKRKNKKIYYYVQFRDDNGLSAAISTGQTSKGAAEAWAIDYIKKGGSLPTQGRMTFEQYAQDWWIYDRCPYIKVSAI